MFPDLSPNHLVYSFVIAADSSGSIRDASREASRLGMCYDPASEFGGSHVRVADLSAVFRYRMALMSSDKESGNQHIPLSKVRMLLERLAATPKQCVLSPSNRELVVCLDNIDRAKAYNDLSSDMRLEFGNAVELMMTGLNGQPEPMFVQKMDGLLFSGQRMDIKTL